MKNRKTLLLLGLICILIVSLISCDRSTDKSTAVQGFIVEGERVEEEHIISAGQEYTIKVDHFDSDITKDTDIEWSVNQGKILKENNEKIIYSAPVEKDHDEINIKYGEKINSLDLKILSSGEQKINTRVRFSLPRAYSDLNDEIIRYSQKDIAETSTEELNFSETEIIISFNDYSREEYEELINNYELKLLDESNEDLKLFQVKANIELDEVIKELENEKIVDKVSNNFTIKADNNIAKNLDRQTSRTEEGNLWHQSALNLPALWSYFPLEELETTKVAVIDTGVDSTHEQLSDNIVDGINYVDGNFNYHDNDGHGTHVAGLISTDFKSENGVKGVNPRADIMPVKVSDDGAIDIYDLLNGILYAEDYGADVINLSMSFPYDMSIYSNPQEYLDHFIDSVLDDVIKEVTEEGVIVVASAGNYNIFSDDPPRNFSYIPAGFDHVISVGSIGPEQLTLSGFSQYGEKMDFVAPGENVLSTYIYNDYAALPGTSMSAPLISGIISLVRGKYPNKDVDEIREIMKKYVFELNREAEGNARYQYSLPDVYQLLTETEIHDSVLFWGQEKEVEGAREIQLLGELKSPDKEGDLVLTLPEEEEYSLYGWVDINESNNPDPGDYFVTVEEINQNEKTEVNLKLLTEDQEILLSK